MSEHENKHEHKHYILIEVREPIPTSGFMTPAARLRQAVHDAMDEHDIKGRTMIIKGDSDRDILGRNIRTERDTLAAIVSSTFDAYATAARLQEQSESYHIRSNRSTKEERQKKSHKSRAQRALAVVYGYTEKYGDDLPIRPKRKGRHA